MDIWKFGWMICIVVYMIPSGLELLSLLISRLLNYLDPAKDPGRLRGVTALVGQPVFRMPDRNVFLGIRRTTGGRNEPQEAHSARVSDDLC